jgi:uncharacterized membrane protein (UPF0127 family)
MRPAAAILLAALLLAVPAAAFAPGQLTIQTAKGAVPFEIELAATPDDRSRGLMHRTAIPDDYGMLFDFDQPRSVQMWMHDTLVSLDMLFIDDTGRVVRIAAHTKPMSDAIIPSGLLVRAVLEIRAGGAAAKDIRVGDVVVHPIFPAAKP